ncbi:glutamate racemase [Candidatus Saganbacteria bacterium]|uniref:Glutamate racemase n=1 Tax=Candidatus Saganbacteria bacterium TaxID=2575572 RepID=A0A9D6UNG5_UNCSA|nr:glutamate racemase [Candidatus Saganbacteria bacterium]
MVTERLPAKISEKSEEKKIAPASPIGIFDSGVGGLTVLAEIMRQLPNEDVIYIADSARVPYGGRPPEEIIKINQELIPYLIDQGVKLIIMACGTSSSIAYPVLKDKYKVHIIGLIEPGVRAALSATRSGTIGVIATAGTIHSQAYQKTLQSMKKTGLPAGREIKIAAEACPLFVPLIEGGFIETEETRKVAKEYLKPLLKEEIDTLILGCTHYPHLVKVLNALTGGKVVLVDPAEEAVAEAKGLLQKAGTMKGKTFPPRYEYLVTGSVAQFQDVGSRLLGKLITHARQARLPTPERSDGGQVHLPLK